MTPNRTPHIFFTPIKSTRAFEEISFEIKRLVFQGVLKPGDRLPSETELARQFRVGRQTIREALRLLELSGIIAIQKGSNGGPVIKNRILNTISNLFLDAFQMEKISIEELTAARCEIEKVVMNHVIENIEESDIILLQENIHAARQKIKNNILAIEENIEFHILLARASKNHLFVIVVGSIVAVLRNLLSQVEQHLEGTNDDMGYNERIIKSRNALKYHEGILNAIIEKNEGEAISSLKQHLEEVGSRLQPFIK